MGHLEENSETYFTHLKFAATIGLTLVLRGGIFILHGLLPVCNVPKDLNLEDTRDKLDKWNQYADGRK